MQPRELLQAGKLHDAIAAMLDEVKRHPTDTTLRGCLCELLCFAGDLERADKQLDAIGHQDPQAMPGVAMFRQLIRAETARRQFFNEGRVPEFLTQPSALAQLHMQATICLREGDTGQAAELLGQAEDQRTPLRGQCNGQEFEDFRDLDDVTASCFEVLTSNGKYYWVPMDSVASLEFRPPERQRDLLWRRVNMTVRDGPEGEVFVPAIYAATQEVENEQALLGRLTEWKGGDGHPVQGVGLRTYLVGEQDRTLYQFEEIEFQGPDD